MKDSGLEMQEEIRRFVLYDLQVNPLYIDDIHIDFYKNGQLRNINIGFLPDTRGSKE